MFRTERSSTNRERKPNGRKPIPPLLLYGLSPDDFRNTFDTDKALTSEIITFINKMTVMKEDQILSVLRNETAVEILTEREIKLIPIAVFSKMKKPRLVNMTGRMLTTVLNQQ